MTIEPASLRKTAKTVLINGASSGLGALLAEKFTMHGYFLHLVARRKIKLDAIAHGIQADSRIAVKCCICQEMGGNPKLEYSGGDIGWAGDNPFIFLDTKKIQSLGWKPKVDIEEGVVRTVRWLQKNEWVLEAKS